MVRNHDSQPDPLGRDHPVMKFQGTQFKSLSTYEIQVSPRGVVRTLPSRSGCEDFLAEWLPQYLPVHRGMTNMTLIFKRSQQKLEAFGGLTSTKFPRKKCDNQKMATWFWPRLTKKHQGHDQGPRGSTHHEDKGDLCLRCHVSWPRISTSDLPDMSMTNLQNAGEFTNLNG